MRFTDSFRRPASFGPTASIGAPLLAAIAVAATALALLTTAQAGIALAHDGQPVPWTGLLKARLVDWYACALFMPLLCWLARRRPVDRSNWTRTLPIHLLVAVPVAVAKETIFVAVGNWFRPGVFDLSTILAEDLGHEIIAVWALSALAHALAFHERAASGKEVSEGPDRYAFDIATVDHFVVRTPRGTRTVQVEDIEYIDAQGNYARLVTPRGRYLVRDTMTRLEERLGPRFLRVHRRVIVRLDAIVRIESRAREGYWLHLKSGERISTGRSYARAIRGLAKSKMSQAPHSA